MNYKDVFEEMYQEETKFSECPPDSKYEFVGSTIFEFTTYDGELDALFAKKMIEVVESIVNRTTFDYIEQSRENYINYITMVNMPFLQGKLEWGTSIRGAWLEDYGDKTIDIYGGNIRVPQKNIGEFLKDLIEWCRQ